MTLFLCHCAGVSHLAQVSQTLDAHSEIRCDIFLTPQKVVPLEVELIK